jgi:hypothetical protein
MAVLRFRSDRAPTISGATRTVPAWGGPPVPSSTILGTP